jgi:hypothetical protein
MKKQLGILLLLWIGIIGSVLGQKSADLAGEWWGTITQSPAGLASSYVFSLSLEVKGDAFIGEARISMEDSTHIYGVMDVFGEIWDESIWFSEVEIQQQNLWSDAYWCLKTYQLEARWVNGVLVLEGSWTSDDCLGSSGRIHLERRLS